MRELREMRRQARKLAWEAASRDPLFLKDLDDVHAAFTSADAETARTSFVQQAVRDAMTGHLDLDQVG